MKKLLVLMLLLATNIAFAGVVGTVCGEPGTPACSVPEPDTLLLMTAGILVGLGFLRRKK